MKKIYLAGPDVFYQDAIQIGKELVALCLNEGFKGLYPMDNVISGESPLEIAQKIKDANIAMLQECDCVIANITPFRGPGADNGTTYEIGFAQALDKPVVLYTTPENLCEYIDRVDLSAPDGNTIENFGLVDNLMFGTLPVYSSFPEALQHIKRYFESKGK